MAVLVIGGSGRGAGKTAVACALLTALPELRWLAVKISPHLHDDLDEVTEELDVDSQKDTGRYLRAGARRAFLIERSIQPSWVNAVQLVREVLELRDDAAECDSLLVESNRLGWRLAARQEERGLSLAVIDAGWEKASVLEMAEHADALVASHHLDLTDAPLSLREKHVFLLPAGEWITDELVEFVSSRLLA